MNFKEAASLLSKIEFLAHFFNPIDKKTALAAVKETASEHVFEMAQIVDQSMNSKISQLTTRSPAKIVLKSLGIGVLFVGGAIATKYVLLPAAISMIHAALSAIAVALTILFTNLMSEKETEPRQKASVPEATSKELEKTKETGKDWAKEFIGQQTNGTTMANDFVKQEQLVEEFKETEKEELKHTVNPAVNSVSAKEEMVEEFQKFEPKPALSGKKMADEFVQQARISPRDYVKFQRDVMTAAFINRNEEELNAEFMKFQSLIENQSGDEILKTFVNLKNLLIKYRNPKIWHTQLQEFAMLLFKLTASNQPPKL